MKKLVIIFSFIFSLQLLITGCSNKTNDLNDVEGNKSDSLKTLVDGTYKTELDRFDKYGWKAFVEVEIKNGKIEKVVYDDINKQGSFKSQDVKYREDMESKVNTYPEKYTGQLEKNLIDNQEIGKVDVVTGATESSKMFKNLASECLDSAAKGDKKIKVVEAK